MAGEGDDRHAIDVKLGSAAPGTHQARVTLVNPVVDSASDTFRVRLELPIRSIAFLPV